MTVMSSTERFLLLAPSLMAMYPSSYRNLVIAPTCVVLSTPYKSDSENFFFKGARSLSRGTSLIYFFQKNKINYAVTTCFEESSRQENPCFPVILQNG